jgi:hypothetical protein
VQCSVRSLTMVRRVRQHPPDPAPEEYSDAGLRLSKRAPLMARPRSGTLKRRPTNRGLSFGVAFRYRGARYYEHFGGEWEGWTE